MTAQIDKRIAGLAVSLGTAAILGGAAWVRDIDVRVALLEDDLTETVEIVALLHPPVRASVRHAEAFHAAGARQDKAQQRRALLQQLQAQAVRVEYAGDDDDSAGDDDDSAS